MSSYKELVDQINDLIMIEFPRSSPEDIHAKCVEISNKCKTVDDKECFDVYYLERLHERLLLTGGKCLEYEKQMAKEIRNFNEMFKPDFDKLLSYIEGSKKISTEFCQQKKLNIAFEPFIIPKICYFLFEHQEVTCSPFADLCDQFEAFYAEHNKRTTLKVNNYYSYCDLKLTFPGKNKEYVIRSNFFCSTILLSLSEKELRISEIVDLLKCNKQYVNTLMKELVKMNLIKRNGAPNNIDLDNDTFCLNAKFRNPNNFIYIHFMDVSFSQIEYQRRYSVRSRIIVFLRESLKLERSVLEEKVKNEFENRFIVSPEMIDDAIKQLDGKDIKKAIEDGKEVLTYIG